MGSPSELSLDYKPSGYSAAQKPCGDQPEQPHKLEEFLACLEEERLKIDAFKRELPLCMQLLNNAMEAYRQQLEMYNTNQGPRPVLEQFIPLKHATNTGDVSERMPPAVNVKCEKASWMTTAQLWSPADGSVKQHAAAPFKDAVDRGLDSNHAKLALDTGRKQRNGGAFLPFTRDRSGRGRGAALPELALAPVEKEAVEKKCTDVEVTGRESRDSKSDGAAPSGSTEVGKGTSGAAPASNPASDGAGQAATTQTQRKARRCWSPELHRRFVNALQMLGGSQVATPKQIRELMKVDGLTNDEVKSHLQKYRLHTRRPIPAPQAASNATTPQLVVLGGIWVPPEYTTTAAAAAAVTGIYGGHPVHAHYCAAPVPRDYYSPPQPEAHHLHQLPPPQHHRGPAAAATAAPGAAGKVKQVSPEPEMTGCGDNSESIEDGKDEAEEEEEEEEGGRSDGSSWKGGDEEALAPAGGDAVVSNGSDVALKI